MVRMEQIEALSQQIGREFHPERIVLFGSYAYGTATEESDVDLLVIVPPSRQRMASGGQNPWACSATISP